MYCRIAYYLQGVHKNKNIKVYVKVKILLLTLCYLVLQGLHLCPHKRNLATETSPIGHPPPTGTIARSHYNATQQTVANIHNLQVNSNVTDFSRWQKSGSSAHKTILFQNTERHKMHGTSSSHRDINPLLFLRKRPEPTEPIIIFKTKV